MARLEAQSKLLYYPTPTGVVEEIAKFFCAPEDLKENQVVRLADPAAGTGEALVVFRDAAGLAQAETWGVELSPGRAAKANDLLTQVVRGSFYEARYASVWPNASVGLAFNNPPYDWSEFQERNANGDLRYIRHEHLFVEYTTRKLVPGGHQVVIVPYYILSGKTTVVGAGNQQRTARHLLGWYEQVLAFRFPDGEYEAFNQIVILAIGRRRKYAPPKKDALETLTASAENLPPLAHDGNVFVIPPAPAGLRMTWTPRTPQEVLKAARTRQYLGSERYRQATYVRPLGTPFTPIMPLSDKEIASLILGQEAGIVRLADGSWVKGSVIKRVVETVEDRYGEDGAYTGTKVRQVEKFDDRITVVRPWGKVEVIEGRKEVADFIRKHIDDFSKEILQRNPPIYDLKPTSREWDVISHVATGLRLPNRDERGLLDIQKHLAIGMARAMRKRRHVILDAEPGFGKTPLSVGILELLGAFPALVVCPGHMPPHWFRILAAASDERERITPRVITRPILGNQTLTYPRLRKIIEANGGVIVENERFQVYPESPKDPMTRRRVAVACAPGHIDGLVKAVKKALGRRLNFRDRWTVEVQNGKDDKLQFSHTVPLDVSVNESGIVFTYVDKDPYTMADFYADYQSGRLGRKAVAIVGFEAAKYDSGFEVGEHGGKRLALMSGVRRVEVDGKYVYQKSGLCPACGKHPFPMKVNNTSKCPHCGAPLYNWNRWRRVGLARLIQKKYRHFFKVYIADEIHNAKSGDTDIGVADQRIISSVKYSLALTGTLYGGTSTSILYLLYRRLRQVRQSFSFPKKHKGEEQRWISVYGRVQRTWFQDEPYVAGTGASTGVARVNTHVKELPYGSPKLVRYLAQVSVAAFIEDLGYALPPLEERVVRVDPNALQSAEFEKFADDYRKKATLATRQRDSKYRDKGAISRWYSHFVARPVTGFRDEEFVVARQVLALPAVVGEGEYLPKERALAEVVRDAMMERRKVLVYVEQSGMRDIRPRLQKVLEALAQDENGRAPAVGVLRTNVKPAQREAWVKYNAEHLDVLLVNPRLVETGLGLTMFSDLVFYEITPVLYRFVQAMKRVWRMGQDKDVRITYLVQNGSLDPIIMERIGKKYQAAQSLRGRLANTVIIDDDDDSILQYLLAQDIAKRTGARGLSTLTAQADLTGIVGKVKTVEQAFAPQRTSPAGGKRVLALPPPVEDRQAVQLALFAGIAAVPVSAVRRRRRRR